MKAWKKGALYGCLVYLIYVIIALFYWHLFPEPLKSLMDALFFFIYPKGLESPLHAAFFGFIQWGITGAIVGDYIERRKEK